MAQISGTDWARLFFQLQLVLAFRISLNLNRQEEKLQFCFIEKFLYSGLYFINLNLTN